MSRTPLIAGNWKMHLRPSEAETFAGAFRSELGSQGERVDRDVEVVLAPAAPALDRLGRALKGSGIAIAAQNVHSETEGAFTGETSAAMLADLGCRYALIGHSERRQIFGEDDAFIAAKAVTLLASTVTPLLCVGETLAEREQDATLSVVGRQIAQVLEASLAGRAAGQNGLLDKLVVAYEPVWAIGTGKTATPEMAQAVHAAIRSQLVEALDALGQSVRILYGGSVKPSNAKELLSQPDIDGALVGGASLDPASFAAIVRAGLETSSA